MNSYLKTSIGLLLAAGTAFFTATVATARPHAEWAARDTVVLEGFHRFAVYSIEEQRYLTTGYDFNFLPCRVTLTFTGKHSFEFFSEEFWPPEMGIPFRTFYTTGSISNSGQLSYLLDFYTIYATGEPEIGGVVDAMLEHMGILAKGRGVNKGGAVYKGSFDGNTLVAEMRVMGHQVQPAFYPFFWKDPTDPTVLFQAPLEAVFTFQLEVVE